MATEAQMNQLQGLYIAYFGRPNDAAGVSYWTAQIDGGATIDQIADRFMESNEFTATSSDLSDVVSAAYTNALGRTAGAEEVAFWVGQIEAGNQTVASLLEAFRSTDDATDSQTLENKITVANAYTAAAVAGANFDTAASVALLAGVDATPASVVAALEEIGAEAPVDNTGLTELLNARQDAQDDVDAFLENWGTAHDEEDPESGDVYAAVDTAEAAVDTAIGAIETELTVTLGGYDVTETTPGEADQLEDAQLSVVKVQIAAEQTKAQQAVTTAASGLNALNKTGLKAAVDAYIAADAAAQSATDAVTAGAENSLVDAAEKAADVFEAGTGVSIALPTGVAAGSVVLASGLEYNAASKAWTVPAALKDSPYLADLQSSVVALLNGYQAADNADKLVDVRLKSVANIDSTQVDDATTPTALADKAEGYAEAVVAQKTLNDLVKDFNDAVEAVGIARGEASELAGLEAAVADSEEALEDAGFAVELVGENYVGAGTSADDIFVLSGLEAGDLATIQDFGTLGNDRLFIGGDYTANAGGLTDGNNSVLEVFFVQNGVNTDVVFETSTFGSSAASPETFTITLTGVAAADLSLSSDGYLTV